jgi:hypothetical protein
MNTVEKVKQSKEITVTSFDFRTGVYTTTTEIVEVA